MSVGKLSNLVYFTIIFYSIIARWVVAAQWSYLPPARVKSELSTLKRATEYIPFASENNVPDSSETEDENTANDSTNVESSDPYWDLSHKEISEVCGTVSSLKCGNEVLRNKYSSSNDEETVLNERCKLRDEFLHCIDLQRRKCKKAAGNHILPLLPPKPIINKLQENVWKALWTSGGCVLGSEQPPDCSIKFDRTCI